jgi:hypothetical protein
MDHPKGSALHPMGAILASDDRELCSPRGLESNHDLHPFSRVFMQSCQSTQDFTKLYALFCSLRYSQGYKVIRLLIYLNHYGDPRYDRHLPYHQLRSVL